MGSGGTGIAVEVAPCSSHSSLSSIFIGVLIMDDDDDDDGPDC